MISNVGASTRANRSTVISAGLMNRSTSLNRGSIIVFTHWGGPCKWNCLHIHCIQDTKGAYASLEQTHDSIEGSVLQPITVCHIIDRVYRYPGRKEAETIEVIFVTERITRPKGNSSGTNPEFLIDFRGVRNISGDAREAVLIIDVGYILAFSTMRFQGILHWHDCHLSETSLHDAHL